MNTKTLVVLKENCPQNHPCPSVPICPVNALKQTVVDAPTVDLDACIRCGKCVDVCPYNALPNYFGLYAEHDRLAEVEKYGIFDCRECGSCTYVCPSRRPLLQLIKDAKRKIMASRQTG